MKEKSKYPPFSNGTDFMVWTAHNCDRCVKASHLRETIDYWGNPIKYPYYGRTQPCKFFKTKNGKYYRCHRASELACEHFERKEE